jgi:hypothetical protein
MLLTITFAVAVWTLVVTGVVAVCTMARRGDGAEYPAAARMRALQRLSPGCRDDAPPTLSRSQRPRPAARRRGARALR